MFFLFYVFNIASISCLVDTYLRFEGRGQLQACDQGPLLPGFNKLQQEAFLLLEANDDFIKEYGRLQKA